MRFYDVHMDERGTLLELVQSIGTQFVSTTHPGVRRGDHYHKIKSEVFTILSGEANLYTRNKDTGKTVAYALHGYHPESIIIRPRTVHAIENVGNTDLVLLVQSDIVFDREHPDTYDEIV